MSDKFAEVYDDGDIGKPIRPKDLLLDLCYEFGDKTIVEAAFEYFDERDNLADFLEFVLEFTGLSPVAPGEEGYIRLRD